GRELREPRRAPPAARSPGHGSARRLRQRGHARALPRVEAAGAHADHPGRQDGAAPLRRARAHAKDPSKRMTAEKDASHWLRRLDEGEWIRVALGELRRAEEAYGRGDARGGIAGAKRAA